MNTRFSGHTPGPWEIRSSVPYGDGWTIFHGRGEDNYTVCRWNFRHGNVERDKELIAAAPSLLALAQELREAATHAPCECVEKPVKGQSERITIPCVRCTALAHASAILDAQEEKNAL